MCCCCQKDLDLYWQMRIDLLHQIIYVRINKAVHAFYDKLMGILIVYLMCTYSYSMAGIFEFDSLMFNPSIIKH